MKNKEKKSKFFKKSFLQTNLSINVILAILSFILNKIKVNFVQLKLSSRN